MWFEIKIIRTEIDLRHLSVVFRSIINLKAILSLIISIRLNQQKANCESVVWACVCMFTLRRTFFFFVVEKDRDGVRSTADRGNDIDSTKIA